MSRAQAPVVEAELHAYVDGQLASDRHDDVVAHLQSDPQARARVEIWRHQNDRLLAAFEPVLREPVPVSLSLEVSAASAYSATPAVGGNRQRTPAVRPPETVRFIATRRPVLPGHAILAFLLGLAIAFAVSGAAFLVIEARRPAAATGQEEDILARLSRRTLEAHRAFAAEKARSFEPGSARPGQMQRVVMQRTGLSTEPPDLATEGFMLAGGRVIPGEAGPDVLLVYETAAGSRLSLVMSGQPAAASQPAPDKELAARQSGTIATVSASYHARLFGFSFAGSHDQAGRILRLIESQIPVAK